MDSSVSTSDFYKDREKDYLNNISNNFYGSITSKETIKSEEITHPEIINETEINNIENENNINNDNINNITASKYEILKKISHFESHKTNSNFIYELTIGFIIISTYDKYLLFYDNNYNNLLKIKFPFIINSVNEIKNTENNIIKIFACSIYYIYLISLDINNKKTTIEKCNISEEDNMMVIHDFKRDLNSDIKNYNYHFIIQLKNSQILCTNYGIYECQNLESTKEKMPKIVLLKQYTEGVIVKDNIICFKSNKQLTNGDDLLTIFNFYSKKVISEINGYSFAISPNRLILINQNEKRKILIGACTQYSSEQKNGILFVNFEFSEDEKFETKVYFEEIEFFSVNCICKLNINKKDNEIFLLAGGVDEEYNKGIIKLYKVEFNDNETNVEFLQNIELGDYIEGSISYIYQLKNGKIIVSCGNGNILYTNPNLDGYNEDLNDDI